MSQQTVVKRAFACTPTLPATPREHFNYDEIDIFCRCQLCANYFTAVLDYEQTKSVTDGHRWHCECEVCAQKRSYHQVSLAHGSRRDLYSELSFLAHNHAFAPQFLGWVLKIVNDSNFKTVGWWANHSQKRALSTWIKEWQKQNLSPALIAVSGMC